MTNRQTDKQFGQKHRISTRLGFTLAEILLTLTIIGIIATLTIPDLVINMQEKASRIQFKKLYSELQIVTNLIKEENGGTLVNVFTDYDVMRDQYLNHMNYIRKCNIGPASSSKCSTGQVRTYLNGTIYVANDSRSRAILSNGVTLDFSRASQTCTANPGFSAPFTSLIICGTIVVDVNGFKGPNTDGKDRFSIWVVRTGSGLLPNGVSGDAYSSCTRDSYGGGCAFKVITNQDY